MNNEPVHEYEVLSGFVVRPGQLAEVGGTVALTEREAKAHVYYGRLRLVVLPPAPEPPPDDESVGGPEIEERDPSVQHRDPTVRRRRG